MPGGIILAAALVFSVPAFSIKWWAAPDEKTVLRTTGIYSIVRNPICLADVLFYLGFAVLFRSVIGIALVPLWWAGWLQQTPEHITYPPPKTHTHFIIQQSSSCGRQTGHANCPFSLASF